VSGDFIQGSTAIGVLIVTIMNSTNNTQYHVYHRNGSTVQDEGTISGLASGHHRVSVFVLEQSGYPFNRTATTPKSLFVMNGINGVHTFYLCKHVSNNDTCMWFAYNLCVYDTTCLQVVNQHHLQLSYMIFIPTPPMFVSPACSRAALQPAAWLWYINESLSSALVD
jgi:hypothetical protein